MARKNLSKPLVVVSEFSPTFSLVCSDLVRNENPTFVSLTRSGAQMLNDMGISPLQWESLYQHDWAEHDTLFREIAVPGDLGDVYLPETDFPLWKSLSLDRMYFWFTGKPIEQSLALLAALNFDDVIVSLDLNTPTIWALATRYPTTAVQTGSIMLREYLDIARYLPFKRVIVRDEVSENFLKKAEFPGEIVRLVSEEVPNRFPQINKAAILSQLGLASSGVTVVVYEPQCEWAFRRWLRVRHTKSPLATSQVAILVGNQREREILLSTCLGIPYPVADDQIILAAADHIITFRYHEDISRGANCPVEVLDVFDRFRAKEIVP